MAKPRFVNKCTDPLDLVPANNGPYYQLQVSPDGNTAYAARGGRGFAIIDITDPENAAHVADDKDPALTGYSYRDCVLIGDYLYVVCRLGVGQQVVGGGWIQKWDVTTDPENPTLEDYYGSEHPSAYARYTAMCTDGTHIYVFGQYPGVYKFDPDDLASGPVDEWEPGDAETHGGDVINGHLFVCRYDNGLTIIDTATMGDTTEIDIAQYNNNGTNLRPWDAVAHEGYVYISTNSSDQSTVNRGMLVIDASDPASVTDYTAFAGYPESFNDTWNDTGDAPLTGIKAYGNRVYLSNGGRGFLCYDISDQENPVALANVGNLEAPDRTWGIEVFKRNGTLYAIYGDGQHDNNPTPVGNRNFYLDEVYPMGLGAFAIGLEDYTDTGNNTAFDGTQGTLSSGQDVSRWHTARPGDYIDQVTIRISAPGTRVTVFGLYTVAANALDALETSFEITSDSGEDRANYTTYDLPGGRYNLTPGVTYAIAGTRDDAASGGSNTGIVSAHNDSGFGGEKGTADSDGVLQDPYSGTPIAAGDIAMAFLGNNGLGGGDSGGVRGSVRGKVRG